MDSIFENPPFTWGLRGDPHLWEALKNYFTVGRDIESVSEFETALYTAFNTITGSVIEAGKSIHVEMFESGGMSSGYVSCHFWLNTGFPMLLERFGKLKA